MDSGTILLRSEIGLSLWKTTESLCASVLLSLK